jgi:vacuolar-type H+-ATPase subunit I/STV1
MKAAAVEVWIWVLIYGGLLTVAVGVFVLRGGGPALGWTLIALGTVATVAGAALVAVRARMEPADGD